MWEADGMDFSDALRAMKQGQAVRRAVWPTSDVPGAYVRLEIGQPDGYDPCFVLTHADGTRTAHAVSAYHVLECDDWVLV